MTEINRETIERLHRRVLYKQAVFDEMSEDLFKREGMTNTVRIMTAKKEAYRSFSDDLMRILDGEEVPGPGETWPSDDILGFDLQ